MDRIKNIKDLAVLAGVSAGTVSRALAGSELISLKTRERIKAMADEHGFRPNVLARNLRIQRTGAIGLVVPLPRAQRERIADPFFVTMMGLLTDVLTERGYDLLVSRVTPVGDQWLEHFVGSGRTDGVVLVGQLDELGPIEAAAERYRPLVVWGGHVAGQSACTVGSDNRRGGAMAVEHLIARGSKRIAFVGVPNSFEQSQRLEGARDAVRAAGDKVSFEVVPEEELRGRFEGRSRAEAPDGIFAASDTLAAWTLSCLHEMGVKVPDEVRVIGYDGLPIGTQVVPQLTTIDQQIEQGVRHLVDLLLRRVAGEDTGSIILEPKLVVRGST